MSPRWALVALCAILMLGLTVSADSFADKNSVASHSTVFHNEPVDAAADDEDDEETTVSGSISGSASVGGVTVSGEASGSLTVPGADLVAEAKEQAEAAVPEAADILDKLDREGTPRGGARGGVSGSVRGGVSGSVRGGVSGSVRGGGRGSGSVSGSVSGSASVRGNQGINFDKYDVDIDQTRNIRGESFSQHHKNNVKDITNQFKDNMKYAAKNAIKGAISAKGKELLLDCAEGRKFHSLQKACKLLIEGMPLGSGSGVVVDFRLSDDVDFIQFEGALDLSRYFGDVPLFNFKLYFKSGVGLIITPETPVRISIAGIIRKVVGSLGLGDIMDGMIHALKLDQFAITIAEIGANIFPFGLRISGSAEIFSFSLPFNLVLGRLRGKTVFALDFNVPGAQVDRIYQMVLGETLYKVMALFKTVSVDLTLSTAEVDLSTYPSLSWEGVTSIPKGLAFSVSFKFNAEHSNPFPRMMAKIMPGAWTLMLYTDGKKFAAAVLFPEVFISKSVILTGCKLEVGLSMSPVKIYVGVAAGLKIAINGDNLLFKAEAEVRLHDPSFAIKLSMVGIWHGALGISKLHIGDLVGEVAITARPPWFGALMLGGTVKLGDKNDPEPIEGKLYFRIDIENPLNNWFYGSLKRLTIGNIFSKLFNVNNLPSIIADSGFPTEVTSSYSLTSTVTPAGDEVPVGYRFKGLFNFLGYKAKADIIVSPMHMKFYVELDPFNLKVIRLSRSRENTAQGPIAHIEGKVLPFFFKCHIEAYIKLFMFEAYTKIYIDDKMMEFHVQVPIFIIFEAEVHVKASYGRPPKGQPYNPSFHFKAKIGTGRVKEGIIQAIRDFKQVAERALLAARRKVEEAQASVHRTADKVCDGGKACGYNCNINLFEEAGLGYLFEQKDHNEFTVSDLEYGYIQDLIFVEETAALGVEKLQEMGIIANLEETNAENDAKVLAEMQAMADHELESYDELDENVKNAYAMLELIDMANLGDTEAQDAIVQLVETEEVFQDMEETTEVSLLETNSQLAARRANWGWARRAFHAVSNVVKKAVHHVSKAVHHVVHHVKKAVNHVVHHVKKAVDTVVHHVKKAVNTVVHHVKKAVSVVASAGCKASQHVCKAGCAVGSGVVRLGAYAMEAAKGALDLARHVVSGVTALIDKVLSSFDVSIQVSGGLDTEGFEFGVGFHLRLGSVNINFNLNINFKWSKIADLVRSLWHKIKNWFLEKIPGLGKLVG